MKKVLANGSLNDQEVFPPNIHFNLVHEHEFYIGKNSTNLPNLWVSFYLRLFCKGQLISKCLFGIFNSPNKQTKKFDLTTMDTSSRIVFVLFLGELKTPKRHFEIN